MMRRAELDGRRLDRFEHGIVGSRASRIRYEELWRLFAEAFPHRTTGPEERRLLLDALRSIEARGTIRLPPEHGRRWDRSISPAVPASVAVVRERVVPPDLAWRSFPWHRSLHWVVQCRNLSGPQLEFLRRVHEGLVHGTFREPAPLRYRSLQLTGDEKGLATLATTSLFSSTRLSLDMLACLPDALPLAWEAVGEGGRMLIFENAGPFAVARRVLAAMASRPYDMVAYGGGRGIVASLGHIRTMERCVESIHYVGDLDAAGLEIACCVRHRARELALPPVLPASELHRQMLLAAASFGYPQGWPAPGRAASEGRVAMSEVLAPDVRVTVDALLKAGRRIPEEVLGPVELRRSWTTP